MNRDFGAILAPVLAVVVLAIVATQTIGALRASGAWSGLWDRGPRAPIVAPDDPFMPINVMLLKPQPELASDPLRDPFVPGAAPRPAVTKGPVVRRQVVAPPEMPVLTAIVWDADPRALVRWQGREWTIRSGGLFAEFQVLEISRDRVTLARGSETILLQRRPQGD